MLDTLVLLFSCAVGNVVVLRVLPDIVPVAYFASSIFNELLLFV